MFFKFIGGLIGVIGICILIAGGVVAGQKAHYDSSDIMLMGLALMVLAQALTSLGGKHGNTTTG
jgi:cell division protein FtsW (lipid II flippase)